MARLIDADALLKAIANYPYGYRRMIESEIENQPTVDAVPVRHGKWIDGHCSLCGCDVPAYIEDWKWIKDMNAKYCPMCGARMDAERKEE